jgi:hypothetical protein
MNSLKNGAQLAAVVSLALFGAHDIADGSVTSREADVDESGRIDILDLLQTVSSIHQFCEGECPTDVDENGVTNVSDLRSIIMFWGESVSHEEPVPEPEPESPTVGTVYAGPDPIVLDGVYYDANSRYQLRAEFGQSLNQGWRTRNFNKDHGIDELPYAYGGGVDFDADMLYTSEDLENFEAWLDQHVAMDYSGPVVLDMEGEWWEEMSSASPRRMEEIIDFYIQGLEYAKAMRPNAKFGYWGLPKKHMTTDHYAGPSMTRLLKASGAIFPDSYEDNPGRDDSDRLRRHVERCVELVEGDIPVYVQMFPRFRNQETRRWEYYFQNDEFIRDQVRASLDAKWVDADGATHRVTGIAIWDCYHYARRYHEDWASLSEQEIVDLWDEIDLIHRELYGSLHDIIGDYAVGGATVEPPPASETPVSSDRVRVSKVSEVRKSDRPRSATKFSSKRRSTKQSLKSNSGRVRGRLNR